MALRQDHTEPGLRPSPAVNVLLVDRDIATRTRVANYLQDHGLSVAAVSSPQEALREFAIREQNLVILNLEPDNECGLDLLRSLRSFCEGPIIITVANSYDEIDCVVTLELGADDCLARPVGLRELLARIRAILRRWDAAHPTPARSPDRSGYRFGGWQLCRRTRKLTDLNGNPVPLTKGEYVVLVAFLDAPQRPLTREHLLHATGVHEDIFDRSIDVRVLRLRRKLQINPSAPHVIRTERGVGYIFNLPVERCSELRNSAL
jgi:two-component system, OmpR family, response regulator